MPRKKDQQRKQYRGILKNPIIMPQFSLPPTLLGGAGKPEKENEYRKKIGHEKMLETCKVVSQLAEKLEALKKHYNILSCDESSWRDLALGLALDHVPGFQVITEKQTGRPEFWNDFVLAKLYFDVSNLMKEREKNISFVCRVLVKHLPWKREVNGKAITVKTLQNKYSEAKSTSIVEAYINLLDDKKINGLAKDYEAMVEKICSEVYFLKEELSEHKS